MIRRVPKRRYWPDGSLSYESSRRTVHHHQRTNNPTAAGTPLTGGLELALPEAGGIVTPPPHSYLLPACLPSDACIRQAEATRPESDHAFPHRPRHSYSPAAPYIAAPWRHALVRASRTSPARPSTHRQRRATTERPEHATPPGTGRSESQPRHAHALLPDLSASARARALALHYRDRNTLTCAPAP